MFVSHEQLLSDGLGSETMRTWMQRVLVEARKPGAPEFTINGPCRLTCRMRKRTSAVDNTVRGHNFIGGERFKISDVYVQEVEHRKGWEVGVNLVPSDLMLARDIAGLSLPLAEAFEQLAGLETFVKTHHPEEVEAADRSKNFQRRAGSMAVGTWS